jgi:hypothetical protein
VSVRTFLAVTRRVRDRLFIPYQVALEYQRNRLKAASDNQIQMPPIVTGSVWQRSCAHPDTVEHTSSAW